MASTALAPMTSYYIHRLLRLHSKVLKSVVVQGGALTIDAYADLNVALESLYLDAEEIAVQARDLETLTRCHQILSSQRYFPEEQLWEIEEQIFWIFALKRVEAHPPAASSGYPKPALETRMQTGVAA